MSADVAACDLFRCMAPPKPFWVTETGSGALTEGKVPYADQLRAWTFSALARGSEGHFFFRWRTCLAGQEQDLQGIIETSGRPRRRYAAVRKLFKELDGLSGRLRNLPLPKADVALISSYDVYWAYDSARIGKHARPMQHLLELHELLLDRNILTDIIPPERDLKGYRLVILPVLCIVPDDLKARLKAFVRAGGVVLATPQLASRDANNNYVPRCAPDGLADLFGLRVESRLYLDNANEADQSLWVPGANIVSETVGVKMEDGLTGQAERYIEDVELESARPLATFSDNYLAGCPAAAVNKVGRGAAFYVAGFLDRSLEAAVLDQALQRAGVKPGPATPKWVEVVRRGRMVFAINHSRKAVEVPMPPGRTVVGKRVKGVARLPAYGVCVVQASGRRR